MSLQPGATEASHREQPKNPVIKAGRGQSVEVKQEGGYVIRLPWWQRIVLRTLQNQQKGEAKTLSTNFTPKEIARILESAHKDLRRLEKGKPLKPHKPPLLSESRILEPSLRIIGLIDGAPSVVEGMDIWRVKQRMNPSFPKMVQNMLQERNFIPQLPPLTPQQEAYIATAIRENGLRPRDRQNIERVLRYDNYLATMYQEASGKLGVIYTTDALGRKVVDWDKTHDPLTPEQVDKVAAALSDYAKQHTTTSQQK